MPSRLRNHVTIVGVRSKKDGKRVADLILIEKTGYLNFTYNGRHYYYNNKAEQLRYGEKLDIEKILINRQKKQQSQQKRTILITKKGG